ncbi:MAG: ABC transporter ATP-binding protein [Clostridiales bacterium]|nr:ABC transporter ATP-binding protein [Clostridiales bacterium]
MKHILKSLRWYDYILVLVTIGCIVCQTYFEMELIGSGTIMLDMISNLATSKELWNQGFKMMGLAGIIVVSIIGASTLASYISSKAAKNLRREVFKKVNSFSETEINKFSTASLITRSTNDIAQVQRTLMTSLRMMITAPCMAFFAIRKITLTDMTLTGVSVGYLVIMLVILITLIVLVLPKFGLLQKRTDRLNLVTRENLKGVRVVRAYNAEKHQESKFDTANNELTSTSLFVGRTLSIMNPSLTLIMDMMTLTIYWVGAVLMSKGVVGVDYSVIATFGMFGMHVIMSFMFITLLFVMIPRGIVSLKRVNEILNQPLSIVDGEVDTSNAIGTIEFRNVSFAYPDAEEKVLEDITFKVGKGETVAFIGSTGSGKSTLINLIPRFYDCTSGQVLVDGVDVKAYNQQVLHDKIGYVPQKANLFSGDITSNMRMSKEDATIEDISKALEVAQCGFIEKLEDGYTQPVSQGGKNFSGGQKQRLSIARAIVKNPEIFIFDDSFSALDFKTDKALRSALKKHTKEATILIVAQRINTIKDADKIIVLDDGKMVGMGTHEELAKSNKVYKEIIASQTKKGGDK